MKVWILQTGEPLHIDKDGSRPMRGMNLANKLIEKGHKVTLWSTKFNHRLKKQRDINQNIIKISKNLEIRLIQSPGYRHNVSIRRIYDHIILGLNLRKQTKGIHETPDVAFLGYPPIEINYFMSNFLFKKKIPYLVDVKDQWPDFFVEVTPKLLKIITKVLILPFQYCAKKILLKASGITSMSKGFLNWSLNYVNRKKNKFDQVVPLTTEKNSKWSLDELNWWKKFNITQNNLNNIMFVGSHYPSLDFDTIIETAKMFQLKNIQCNFIICGEGELTDEIKRKSYGLKNVIFPGWVDRSKVEALATISIAAICPFKNIDNYRVNIPNKIIDALSLSLPILSPLDGEVSELINEKKIGLKYKENSHESLFNCINQLLENQQLLTELSDNSKKTYDELFDFDKVYNDLITNLEILSRSKIK